MWVLFLQLVCGSAWAAFELAALLDFFEHIPIHGRTSLLSVYNLAHAVAIVADSSIGGVCVLKTRPPASVLETRG